MTTEEYMLEWLNLRRLSLKPRTIEMYADLIDRYIVPALGGISCAELAPTDIAAMLARIYDTGHTRTAELVYITCKAALSDLPQNPMRRIPRPKHKQTSPKPWDDATIRSYSAAIKGHKHELALSLALFAGLRRGEICGLRWESIDQTAGTISITTQRTPTAHGVIECSPKSESSIRVIPIPTRLRPLIAAQALRNGLVCPLSPSGLDQAHKSICRAANLPYTTLHGLRHTMATACIRHGADMRCMQILLGHSSYAITAHIYTHPDKPMLQSAIDISKAA